MLKKKTIKIYHGVNLPFTKFTFYKKGKEYRKVSKYESRMRGVKCVCSKSQKDRKKIIRQRQHLKR